MKADSRSGRSLARCGRLRAMIWPGTPTTTELGGTDFTTTALAPMRLSSPIVIAPSTLAPAPIVTRLPDARVTLHPLEARATEGDTLINGHVVTDLGRLADHNAAGVVDEHALA